MNELGDVAGKVLDSRISRERCVVILANSKEALTTAVMREGRKKTSPLFDTDEGALYAALTAAMTLAHDIDEDLTEHLNDLRSDFRPDDEDGDEL